MLSFTNTRPKCGRDRTEVSTTTEMVMYGESKGYVVPTVTEVYMSILLTFNVRGTDLSGMLLFKELPSLTDHEVTRYGYQDVRLPSGMYRY